MQVLKKQAREKRSGLKRRPSSELTKAFQCLEPNCEKRYEVSQGTVSPLLLRGSRGVCALRDR
jgi:hypothetical protein